MQELQPGSELAGFRIEAVEREDVLLARETAEDRSVALHVATDPPGTLATIRFVERVRRLRSVEHPHLLTVYGSDVLAGRQVAITQAPPGKRLDRLNPNPGRSLQIVRQIADAVDALEEAGVEPPPLIAERIWVDAQGDAHLDGLDTHSTHRAASSSAALAELLEALAPRAAPAVVIRARDGAYLSAGQFAEALARVEAQTARRRRRTALIAALAVALVVVLVCLEIAGV